MSKSLLPGLRNVVEHNLSVRQAEIIFHLLDKDMSIKEITSKMEGTSESSVQNHLLKLKLKELVIGKTTGKSGLLIYSVNKKLLN